MVRVVCLSTSERESEFDKLYRKYKRLYLDTDLPVTYIVDNVLDISDASSLHKQLQRKLFNETGVDAITRREYIKKGEWVNKSKKRI